MCQLGPPQPRHQRFVFLRVSVTTCREPRRAWQGCPGGLLRGEGQIKVNKKRDSTWGTKRPAGSTAPTASHKGRGRRGWAGQRWFTDRPCPRTAVPSRRRRPHRNFARRIRDAPPWTDASVNFTGVKARTLTYLSGSTYCILCHHTGHSVHLILFFFFNAYLF